MSELRITEPQVAAPVHGGEAAPAASIRPTEPSIEFRALLERLREQAAALQRSTEKPLNAVELSGAVQEAGASLQGALSIAEGLLEAYRASQLTAVSDIAHGAAKS